MRLVHEKALFNSTLVQAPSPLVNDTMRMNALIASHRFASHHLSIHSEGFFFLLSDIKEGKQSRISHQRRSSILRNSIIIATSLSTDIFYPSSAFMLIIHSPLSLFFRVLYDVIRLSRRAAIYTAHRFNPGVSFPTGSKDLRVQASEYLMCFNWHYYFAWQCCISFKSDLHMCRHARS